jgi:hypothetical protein
MKSRILGVAASALMACAAALATTAAFGTSVAQAGRYYVRPPVTAGDPGAGIPAVVAIAFALAIAIEIALVVYFTLLRKQSGTSTRAKPARAQDESKESKRRREAA